MEPFLALFYGIFQALIEEIRGLLIHKKTHPTSFKLESLISLPAVRGELPAKGGYFFQSFLHTFDPAAVRGYVRVYHPVASALGSNSINTLYSHQYHRGLLYMGWV